MIKTIFCGMLLLLCTAAFAHPHVWLDSSMYVSGGVIKVRWTFDKMFSNVILSDYDIDRDKQLVGLEAKHVKENMFDNLQYFDYFTMVYCGAEPVPLDGVTGFQTDVEDGKVIYSFDVRLSADCADGMRIFSYDSSNYTDIKITAAKGRGSKIKMDKSGLKYVAVGR